MKEPKLIKGGLAVDDRGQVAFVNEFLMDDVKRFYHINNHSKGFIRAWHGHKKERKYFTVVNGAFMICGVKIDNWENPSKDIEIHKFVLSEKNPSILFLPEGYANGFMSLTDDAKLMVFSSSTLEESLNDDFRYASNFWNPWKIIER